MTQDAALRPASFEGWSDTLGHERASPTSDDSGIDAEGAVFKVYYGHRLRLRPPRAPQL